MSSSFFALAFTVVLLVTAVRRAIIPAMGRLGSKIQDSGPGAIAALRRVHPAALWVNLVQLVVPVWGVTRQVL